MSYRLLRFEQDRQGDKKVIVSDIQRFSVHDGPGIRTVVFVQGCPLRCRWCQNPEDLRTKPQLMVNREACIGCGECVIACPRQATSLDDQGRIRIDRDLCAGCGTCEETCYAEARRLSGRLRTVEEVYREILKDVVFYRNSGGGVTLSGGEITMFPDFAAELLGRCQAKGIHTAIETCGHTRWENLEQIARHCDLVLYDIKLADPKKAKSWTGVDNGLILQNAKELAALGKKMIIRIPLIPGVNEDEAEFTRIVEFAAALGGVDSIHILPFHHLGRSKYEALDLEYPLTDKAEADETVVQQCVAIGERVGLKVSVGGAGFLSDIHDKDDKKESGFIYRF